MKVAVVALGPSAGSYVRMAEGVGDLRKLYDEVWCVNGFANVLQCDRGFAMDDIRIQEIRARGGNKKVANLLDAYKRHPGPIYTSRVHPDYPALVEYPLERVVNETGAPRDYFNSTVAYPIALAICEGATHIAVYGADYSFPNNPHMAEKGRGCVEWWLGRADARGIKIGVPHDTTLLDASESDHPYGYDLVKITRERDENGYTKFSFEDLPEEAWPTAEQIEKNYYKGFDKSPFLGEGEHAR